MKEGKEASLYLQKSPGWPPRPGGGAQPSSLRFRQAMLHTRKPVSSSVHICGWENVQKTQKQSEGEESSLAKTWPGLSGD